MSAAAETMVEIPAGRFRMGCDRVYPEEAPVREVAVAALIAGAVRQRRTAEALRRGSYEALSSPLVMWLTAAAVLLSIGTVALVAVRF